MLPVLLVINLSQCTSSSACAAVVTATDTYGSGYIQCSKQLIHKGTDAAAVVATVER